MKGKVRTGRSKTESADFIAAVIGRVSPAASITTAKETGEGSSRAAPPMPTSSEL